MSATILVPSSLAFSRELTRFSASEMRISKDRFTEFTADDESAVDQIFRNNTCMAPFLPEDVARNVVKIALGDEGFAARSKDSLKLKDFTWRRNPQNQSYVPAYAVMAQILRGIIPAGTNLRGAFKKIDLTDVNAAILSHKREFAAKVEALANAGFRFQIEMGQQHTKLGALGIIVDSDHDLIDEMASQLKYATKNDDGGVSYYDSAFFLAYLMEAANIAAGSINPVE